MSDETLLAHLIMETGIGAIVDTAAPRFPGLQAHHLGFGQDLRPTIAASLYTTMALRPDPPRIFNTLRWQADDIREQYRTVTLKHYADSGLPLDETRLPDVLRRLAALQPERVYSDLSFEDVQHEANDPERLSYPTLKIATSWQHSTFARMVIGERLHHLRTTEMVDANAVWARILELFASYNTTLNKQTFQLRPEKYRRKEMAALYFAAYEQLLRLRYEEATRQPRYLSAILERPHSGSLQDEQILALEPEDEKNPGPAPRPNLLDNSVRLAARRDRYRSLIEHLQHQTANGLMSLVDPPTSS